MRLKSLDQDQRLFLWRWGILGVLIRVLFMPFAAHGDFFAEYDRANRVFDTFDLSGLGPSRVMDLLHGVYFRLAALVVPRAPVIFDTVRFSKVAGEPEILNKWLELVNSQGLFRVLFVLKLPYLVMDIAGALLVLRLFDSWRQSSRAYLFWMLNPVLVFTSYIFGRYDIAVVLLLVLSLVMAKEGRRYISVFFLAVAAVLRISPIILLPAYVLALGTGWRDRSKLALVGLAPLLAAAAVAAVGRSQMSIMPSGSMHHTQYPLAMSIGLLQFDRLYISIFAISIALMLFYVFPEQGFERLKKSTTTVMLIFFATSFFHPHYLAWLVPFAVLFAPDIRFVKIYAIQVVAWFGYSLQWGRSLTSYMFASISPAYFWAMPEPADMLGGPKGMETLGGMSRSILSAASAVLIYLIWRRRDGETDA